MVSSRGKAAHLADPKSLKARQVGNDGGFLAASGFGPQPLVCDGWNDLLHSRGKARGLAKPVTSFDKRVQRTTNLASQGRKHRRTH